jgi:hypothetical protein
MKTLRETLTLTGARCLSLNRIPTKAGYTCVLKVKGPLNPVLADTLRCRNQAFTLNDTPYASLSSFTLDHEISSCELAVRGHAKIQPSIVTGFKIVPSEAADADGALEVHFRMKFLGKSRELNELCDSVDNNPFDLAVIALQESLFDPQPTGDGPEGGTKVDLTGDGAAPSAAEEPASKPRGKKAAAADVN